MNRERMRGKEVGSRKGEIQREDEIVTQRERERENEREREI